VNQRNEDMLARRPPAPPLQTCRQTCRGFHWKLPGDAVSMGSLIGA